MRSSRLGKQRNSRGVMIILLMFIIAFFLVGVLGVFTFEVSRINTAREELRSAAEAASLSGAASLASSDSVNTTVAHTAAVAAAVATFQANSINGVSLASATQTSDPNNNPSSGQTTVYVEFLDPNNNYAVVSDMSSPLGKVVHVIGAQGYIPPFGKYAGVPNMPIRGDAQASVPALDIVMCFDCSASIDDQTLVTFCERYLNTSGSVAYYIYDSSHDGNSVNISSGQLYNVVNCSNSTGTPLNGCPPQNLSSYNSSASPGKLSVDWGTRSGNPDYGTLPTNSKSKTPSLGSFTDEVVNIDGNTVFANGSNSGSFSVTYNGKTWPFPNVATLIEAARGNLESKTVMTNSGASSAANGVPTSVQNAVTANGAGYQDAYMTAARAACQPIGKAQQAALTFFSIMNTNTDAHFAFVPFASSPSTSTPTSGDSGYVVDGNVSRTWYNDSANSEPKWVINGTTLSSVSPSTSYTTITASAVSSTVNDPPQSMQSLVTSTIANGGTDIGDSIVSAGKMLQTTAKGGQSRSNAKRVIIFFTDGLPTAGTDAWTAASTINSNNANIAIYTIGLAQNSKVIQGAVDCLNSTGSGSTISYTDPVTGNGASVTCSRDGISKIAGNGGQFFLVTNVNNLNYVFENIARQLVSLVRN